MADIPERLFPVGRLDYNTTGLLIMTNDGELTYTLTHPKHEVYKTYVAVVAGVLSDSRVARLRKGVDIGGFVTSPAKVKVIKQLPRRAIVEIQIREGKNRQVRKMFEADGDRQYSSGTADGGSLPEIEPGRNRVPEKSLDLISLIVYRDLTVLAGDPIMGFASGFVSEYFS